MRFGHGSRCAAFLAVLAACETPGSTSGGAARYQPATLHRIESREVPYDVEHYSIELDLDPLARAVRGRCTIRLWPTRETLERVELDFEGLDVTRVLDRDGVELAFRRDEEELDIELARALVRGENAEFTVEYGGRPRKGLWFTRVRDGVPTQVFTHGECRDAHWWFPCHDEPFERATSELRVTMPANWTSIAAGERVDRAVQGERATETWRATFPHPAYLETLVAGELYVETSQWNGVPLVFAAAPEFKDCVARTFAETDEILTYFSELTGARYPYAKYAQSCVDGFPFGGMENVSATTLIDVVLPDARMLADANPTGLIAHEAAHQWFGDLVTCKDWSHAWLNEGFATYFAALYTEHARGPEAFRLEMRRVLDEYLARDVGLNRRPIVHALARDALDLFFTGHIYQGAAVRLHHLRSVIGDEAFFAGVRAYLSANKGRAVETRDLEHAMSQACGENLRWFFEQWFETPGFPKIRAWWGYDEDEARATLHVEQTQDAAAGDVLDVFRIPVDVEVATGRDARIARVVIDRREQSFTFAALSKPDWIRLDPRACVPMFLDERAPVSEWRMIAEQHGDAVTRAGALRVLARALRESQSPTDREELGAMLLERLQGDPTACVRLAAAHGMRGLETPAVRATLQNVARDEIDRDVRAAAFEGLAAFAPDADLEQFALEQFERADSWNVAGAIAGLRARAAPDTAFDWLRAQLATPSWHGVWQARIENEIATLGDPRARELFLSIAMDDAREDAERMAAVRALGQSGHGSADVRRRLASLLASDRFRLRREVIGALGELRESGAQAILREHWTKTVFESEKRAIENVLLAATAGDG